MRRRHRTAYARTWVVLAILLPLVVLTAMVIRQQGPMYERAVEVDVSEAVNP